MPVAEAVEVMNRHDLEGGAFKLSLPRLPVRDAAHVNGGEDRVSKSTRSEKRGGLDDRRVKAHVLVYSERDAL